MKMSDYSPSSGFTLIEMTVVLVIIATLLAGMLLPLAAQVDQRRVSETQKLLEEVNQALIGFAIANGRLPCPASPASAAVENPPGGGTCVNPHNGFLPAITLGLGPTDDQGHLVDAWGLQQNRIRYAVTESNGKAFTTTDEMRVIGISGLGPDLRVCATSTGITATTCAANQALTNNAPAVVFSLGKNAPTGGVGVDEAANLNGDPVFISHTPTPVGAANGEFDDLVVWLSPNILYNRMVTAGKLP